MATRERILPRLLLASRPLSWVNTAYPFGAAYLLAGGGVAGMEDLRRLAGAGCDGALVATALHSGRIGQSSASASRQVADWP